MYASIKTALSQKSFDLKPKNRVVESLSQNFRFDIKFWAFNIIKHGLLPNWTEGRQRRRYDASAGKVWWT